MRLVPTPLRHAGRRLGRAPGFTAASVMTLALGLGATTAAFAVVRGVLLRPLPYPQAERLVSLSHTLVVNGDLRVDQSDATLLFYRRHAQSFSHIGGHQTVAAAAATEPGVEAERVAAARVTADLFPALEVPPLAGRVFTLDDDRPGAAPVVIVGERLWTRKYGRDPNLLRRRILVDAVPHDIVGIMPAGFRFPSPDTELWIPMRLDPAKTESATFDYHAIARLRDGVTLQAATDELTQLLPRLPEEFPGRMTRASIEQTRMRASVRPLAAVIVADAADILWLLFGAAAVVLATVSANVANLCVVRAESRHAALAVQRALGASTATLVVDFACEGALIAAAGGALGALGAAWAIGGLRSIEGLVDIPRLHEVSIDWVVAAAAALVAVFAALLVTLVPAAKYAAVQLPPLRSATPTSTPQRHRSGYVLVASQVALSLTLLAGAGLLARSVWRLREVDTGFDPSHAVTFRLAVPTAAYPGNAAAAVFFARAAERIAALSGVRAVGIASKVPLDDRGRVDSAVFVEDRPLAAGALPAIHRIVYASPEYFAAAGIPIADGRSFTRSEPSHVVLEAVVSRVFAERYWNGASPIGRRVRTYFSGPWYTIVGVAGDIRDAGLDRPDDSIVYCPLVPPPQDPRWAPRDLAFVVRTAGDAAAISGRVRDALRTVDPSVPVYRVATLADVVAHAYARRTLMLELVGAGAIAALLLAALGLYGVIAYVVTLRTREIGIRVALGAAPGEVRRLVCRDAARAAGIGIAAGLVGAVGVGRALAALLFQVRPTDSVVLAGSTIALACVAAAASWLPARRAAGIDPAVALRAE